MSAGSGDVTELLLRVSRGQHQVLEQVIPIVYGELRRLARHHLRNERAGHTLQPTALINEAYMRLAGFNRMDWKSRAHFIAVASRLMRQILIDHARRRDAVRRGGPSIKEQLEDGLSPVVMARSEEFLDLDAALRRLEALSPIQCRIVEMQYFGGLTVEEIAEVVGVSPRTVKRHWSVARAWLFAELTRSARP